MADSNGKNVTPKTKRRWWQFSIATMLAVTAVVAVCLGLWTSSARRQEQAVRSLREKGWRILYHHENESPANPVPPGPAWVRDWLGLDYVDYVEAVGFAGDTITDDDLATLRSFPRLTSVVIEDAPNVTDAGLAHLATLRDLDTLFLVSPQITDDGLVYLRGLQMLEHVHLDSDRITDAGLVHLKELRQLWSITLKSNHITDAGLVHLKGLKLYSMWLVSDRITDAGLVHLKPHKRLDFLGVDGLITDAGMEHLLGFTNLEGLRCSGPTSDKPRRKLATVVTEPSGFDRTEWTPRDVILYLDDLHEIAASLDQQALAESHIDPTTQISSDIQNLPDDRLSLFLDALLHPHGLGWHFGDGELIITTLEVDNEKHAGLNKLRATLPKLKKVECAW